MRHGIPLLGRLPIPLHGFLIILRHALAFGIHRAKVVLRSGMPLLGRFPKPLHRFLIILRHTFAFGIHRAKVALRHGIPLLGRLPIPLCRFRITLRPTADEIRANSVFRFRIILRHAVAKMIHQAKAVLRLGMPLLGRFSIPLCRFKIIPRHVVAYGIQMAKFILRIGISLLGFYFRRLETLDFFAFPLLRHFC